MNGFHLFRRSLGDSVIPYLVNNTPSDYVTMVAEHGQSLKLDRLMCHIAFPGSIELIRVC
jgi:hypothetical protein